MALVARSTAHRRVFYVSVIVSVAAVMFAACSHSSNAGKSPQSLTPTLGRASLTPTRACLRAPASMAAFVRVI
jgi:hypothetical protein